jgi:Fur family peroxide stress response transcriptional regulator
MALRESEVERRVAAFVQALRAGGFRVTHQRLEVAREVARSEDHPDVEAVFNGVRRRVPTISLDTVYRTVAELERHGLVRRVSVTRGPARYDANTLRHHHFVCRKCGLIRDLYGEHLDDLEPPAEAVRLGRVEDVEVRFSGVCAECMRREEKGE